MIIIKDSQSKLINDTIPVIPQLTPAMTEESSLKLATQDQEHQERKVSVVRAKIVWVA